MFAYWLAFRYALKRQPGAAANFLVRMAIMSLASGVMLLILVLAVMSGFELELKQKILNLAPHITVGRSTPLSLKTQQNLIESYRNQDFVLSIDPVVELKGLLVKGQKTQPVVLLGLSKAAHMNQILADYYLSGGDLGDSGVALSQSLADDLGVEIADSILVMLADDGLARRQPKVRRVSVGQIFDTRTELDRHLVVMPFSGAQRLGDMGDSASALYIHTGSVMDAGRYARRLYELNEGAYWVRDWTFNQGNLYQAIQTSRQMVMLMLVVIIAVAAMNIVTAMTMVVNNKNKEIAMLMAMGLRPRTAMQVILIQGVLIAIVGIGIGLVAGIILALSVTDMVAAIERFFGYQFLKSDIYPITYLPAAIEWQDIAGICIPAFVITLIAALYPAWRATKVLPAEALRYDK